MKYLDLYLNDNLIRQTSFLQKSTSQKPASFRFNPKRPGGGLILPFGQEIACHFSQDHTMVTKFPDFIHKHPKYKVVKSFFYYLDRSSRNSAETEPRLWFFGIENHKIDFFFNFFITKFPNFISNLNEDCFQLSFEVYNVCVAQKLRISEFLIEFFSAWTLATSATSRGRNFNLSNLNRVSNFSSRPQLSYETLFVAQKLNWEE